MAKQPDALRTLYEAKVQKLDEQKALSDRMNDILTRRGGLNDNSKNVRKNLMAAIAVSKQPGYFEYYQTPAEVKEVEDTKTLNSLVKSLDKVHKELDQINSEISHYHERAAQPSQPEVALTSLSQWFETYGRPENTQCLEERMTTFQASPKIYGGTNHHRAFKSQAANMKKGRVTK
mmetsp:Transcript_21670/g.31539  ORF Transcript_21670/g.31539 Transcript_21670/m.31539 type:complete len:176 (+) Transcript_21670:113-640(+)